MKLSKSQALTIVKNFAPITMYYGGVPGITLTPAQEDLVELQEKLEEYLTTDSHEDENEEEQEDDEADDEPADEEDEEGEDEDDEEVEEDDDGDEEELEVDGAVSAEFLHNLVTLRATCDGTKTLLEFDAIEGTDVDALCDNADYTVPGVTHIKRMSKQLHIRSAEGSWHVFTVTKFPVAWTKLLPNNKLLEIVE